MRKSGCRDYSSLEVIVDRPFHSGCGVVVVLCLLLSAFESRCVALRCGGDEGRGDRDWYVYVFCE
jgi:hypothetical protein